MNYICPYCQYVLSIDSEYYYCHNHDCEIGYSFLPDKEEELSWKDSKYFIRNDLKKCTFNIWEEYTDLTEIMGHHFDSQELMLQGKSKEYVVTIMDKFEKMLKLKVFW